MNESRGKADEVSYKDFFNFVKQAGMSDGWLNLDEAATYLSVSKDTLRSWIKDKDSNSIPAYRVGKLWRFKVSELDEWVKNGGNTK